MIARKQGRRPDHAVIIELVTRPRGASFEVIAKSIAARRSFVRYSTMRAGQKASIDRSAKRYLRLLRDAFLDRGIALVRYGKSYVIVDAKHLDAEGATCEVLLGRKKHKVRREVLCRTNNI